MEHTLESNHHLMMNTCLWIETKYHSINVQRVCDEKLRFINIVSKWTGSTHYSFILENSPLKNMFETGAVAEGWLLGKSGYPLRPWLLTPVINPTTEAEERYNRAHIKTRNTVERRFGVFKSRFRCLDTREGTFFYSSLKAYTITVAAALSCHHSWSPFTCWLWPCPRQRKNRRPNYISPENDGLTTRNRLFCLINVRFAR